MKTIRRAVRLLVAGLVSTALLISIILYVWLVLVVEMIYGEEKDE